MDKYLVIVVPLNRLSDRVYSFVNAYSLIEAIHKTLGRHEGEPISARKLEDNADGSSNS